MECKYVDVSLSLNKRCPWACPCFVSPLWFIPCQNGTQCASGKNNSTQWSQCDSKSSLTYCCIVSGDINQDLCGASSTNVSVAVPHAGNQVRLANKQQHGINFQHDDNMQGIRVAFQSKHITQHQYYKFFTITCHFTKRWTTEKHHVSNSIE